jgi:hypothetical protein
MESLDSASRSSSHSLAVSIDIKAYVALMNAPSYSFCVLLLEQAYGKDCPLGSGTHEDAGHYHAGHLVLMLGGTCRKWNTAHYVSTWATNRRNVTNNAHHLFWRGHILKRQMVKMFPAVVNIWTVQVGNFHCDQRRWVYRDSLGAIWSCERTSTHTQAT